MTSPTTSTPARRMRELMARPGFIMGLGVWDAYTARLAETLGMECVHIGGYQLGMHYVTSEPLLTMTEMANTTRYVTAAVKIPVIVDVGAGFGEPLHVMRMTRELERAGAAGIQMEDQIYPKRVHYHKGVEHIIPAEEMVEKIKAAVAARKDPDMLIVGRTDGMRTHGFDEGIRRANMYFDAGADMVMVFPNNLEEARRCAKEMKGPVAATNSEGNRLGRPTFTAAEYNQLGFKFASYPTALLCPITQQMKQIVTRMRTEGASGFAQEDMMVWRKEVEDLIGMDELYRIESETVEK